MEALRLPNSTIVVADNGSASVRFYTADGAFISSSGRQGAGPGEYRNLRILGRYGTDSLIAWDPPLRRATILTTNGSLARTFEAKDFGDAYAFFHAVGSDGTLVGTIGRGIQLDTMPPGVVDNHVHYIRLRPTGEIDTIGKFQWNQGFVTTNRVYMDLPFGRTPVHAAVPDGFYYGSNESHEIHRYGVEGQLISILRIARTTQELSQANVATYIEDRLDQLSDSDQRQYWSRLLNEISFPNRLPAFDAIRVDALGNLWLADYHTGDTSTLKWWIYSSDGAVLATANTPAAFEIREVGADYVFGVLRDEMGVEYVVQYGLDKD
jgi:hypothetical protein